LKNTTDGKVGLPSSSVSRAGLPGRTSPTVEFDVPKSTPQALAMEPFIDQGAVCYQIQAGAANVYCGKPCSRLVAPHGDADRRAQQLD
jgi:hypothetical protein